MRKGLIILISILGTFFLVVTIGIWYGQSSREVGTYWIDKKDGGGPWTVESGSRTEEEKAKALENSLQPDAPIAILKSTSEVGVLFSTGAGSGGAELNQVEAIPEAKY